MRSGDFGGLMWGEALALLERAERLQRQFFRVAPARGFEPPVDVIESADAVHVMVALPGAAPESIVLRLERDALTVSAQRPFPSCGDGARIHRLEIPYGRFERRIALPLHALELTGRSLTGGVLALTFAKRG